MSYKLDRLALALIALAILFACASRKDLKASPYLEGKYESAQAPGPALTPTPPLAPAFKNVERTQENSVPAYDPTVESILTNLELMKFEGWTGQPTSIHRFTNESKSAQLNANAASESQGTKVADPSILDLVAEFGCTTSAQRIFAGNQSQIVASIYKFATTEGAYGAYCGLRKGASNLIARGGASSEDDKNISFWKDRYFVNISETLSEEEEENKAIVRKIADQLAASIPTSSARPRILYKLPASEKVLGSEKIVMGPLALKKFFPAPFIGTLAQETLLGAIADYQVQEPYRVRLKLLVLQFANKASASLSYTKYVSQLEEQHDEQALSGVSYQTSVFKAGNTYLLCQIRGDELIIITGARKKLSLPALASEIY